MCGLVGMIGTGISAEDKQIFKWMLWFDGLKRGLDGTGIVAYYPHSDRLAWDKAAGGPENLWKKGSPRPEHVVDKDGLVNGLPTLIMGHNRKTTMGASNDANAHPFDYPNLIGMHNGTLNQYYLKDLKHKDKEVDSDIFYGEISEVGFQEAYNKIYGAMALTWFDKEKKQLHLFRNSQRPLFLAYNAKRDVTYWASEKWMINFAVLLTGADLVKNEKNDNNLYEEVKEEHLYTFTLEDKKWVRKEEEKIQKKHCAHRPMAPQNTGIGGQNRGMNGGNTQYNIFTKNQNVVSIPSNNWKKDTAKDRDPGMKNTNIRAVAFVRERDRSGKVYAIWRARTIPHGHPVDIIFRDNNDAFEKFSALTRSGKYYFRVESHMRRVLGSHPPAYRVFHSHVKPSNLVLSKAEDTRIVSTEYNAPDKLFKPPMADPNLPVVNSLSVMKGYMGEVLTQPQLEVLLKKQNFCCFACDNILSWEDRHRINFVSKGRMICDSCYADDDIKTLAIVS